MTYSMQPSIATSRGPSCAAMMRALLCLLFCLVLFLLCRTGETSQHSLNCCLKTGTDKIPGNRVVDYAVQTAGLCPISAIVLWTTRGKAKCYDPYSEWIRCIMNKVDQKKMSKQTSDPTASPSQNRKPKNIKVCKQKKLFLEEEKAEMPARPINSASTFKTKSTPKKTSHWKAEMTTRPIHSATFKTVSTPKEASHWKAEMPTRPINSATFKTKSTPKKTSHWKAEMTTRPINSATFKTESTAKKTNHWNGQDEPRTSSSDLTEFVYICL